MQEVTTSSELYSVSRHIPVIMIWVQIFPEDGNFLQVTLEQFDMLFRYQHMTRSGCWSGNETVKAYTIDNNKLYVG